MIFSDVINKVEADTYIDSDIFFVNNHYDELPILLGIFNLETKQLMEYNPNKIFFNKIPVFYDENAECPNIDKHFNEVLETPEDVKVMYELFGYLLFKDHFIEQATMMFGTGRNGKGKTIDLMKRFIGIENCSSVPLSAMREDSFRVSELFGKMANLAGDLSNTSLKETGIFKELTARDLVGAKRKFMTDIKFVNTAKIIFAANELPKVYDFTDGFWERWLLFKFNYKFVTQEVYDALSDEDKKNHKIMDPYLIDKISTQEELNGLFIKALEGLKTIRINGKFSRSQNMEEIRRYWMRTADSFMAFALDCLEESYDSTIRKRDLRMRYNKYCKEHRIKGVSDKSILITLQELFGATDGRKVIFETQEPVWEGVKFK